MGRVKTMAQLEAEQEKLAEAQKQLAEQLKKRRAMDAAAQRKQRNHALVVIGALVEQHFLGGDWTTLDPNRLARYLHQYSAAGTQACQGEKLDPDEANRRIRDWERRHQKALREAKKQQQG